MSQDLKLTVLEKLEESIQIAKDYYLCTFPLGEVNFNLRGRAAGQVRFPLSKMSKQYSLFGQKSIADGLPEIRFNPKLLTAYKEEFVREVVPHECAHLVVYRLFQLNRLQGKHKPKPHGKEWQFVMRELYGLEPNVTHKYELDTNTAKRFLYYCGCENKQHQLTVIRHNKICRDVSQYKCRYCGEILKQAVVA